MRGKKRSLDGSTRHDGSMKKHWYLVTVSAIGVRDGVASRVIVVVVVAVAIIVLWFFTSVVAVVIVVISVVGISAWKISMKFSFPHELLWRFFKEFTLKFTCHNYCGIQVGNTSSDHGQSIDPDQSIDPGCCSMDLPAHSNPFYLYNNNRRNIWIKVYDLNFSTRGEKFIRKAEKNLSVSFIDIWIKFEYKMEWSFNELWAWVAKIGLNCSGGVTCLHIPRSFHRCFRHSSLKFRIWCISHLDRFVRRLYPSLVPL